MKIGFIGCGNMAKALIGGIVKNKLVEPQDILAVHDGKIMEYLYPEKPCEMDDVSRVKTPEMTEYAEFQVKYSDIDVNGHLNSMKYIDHVMDLFSLDHYRNYQLRRMEIAYVAEGHFGDTVRIYHIDEGEQTYAFKLCRVEEEKETELCRVKLSFKQK